MRYEQRVGIGRLLLVSPDEPTIEVDLKFEEPVRLNNTRTIRKLLELSGRGGPALLADGMKVYGLGRLTDDYEPSTERVFELLVLGDGTWELRHDSTPLVTVKFGAAKLPSPRLGRDRFVDVIQRVFRDDESCDPGALWQLVEAAADAEHGTMIVVAGNAREESQRLRAQGLPVEPARLRTEVVHNVTQIDGAVLVDPKATCHGLGVILDGIASGDGDRSRGARYNSAVKYLESAADSTVIVIVSEDGMINVLPDLRPMISRTVLEEAMTALRSAASIEPVHAERFYRAFDRVKAMSFYLSQGQCDEVTRLCREHWERRSAEGAGIIMTPERLVPHPEVDDSYFTD